MHSALSDYEKASQAIYESWYAGTMNEFLPRTFQSRHLPEPYLDFGLSQDKDFCVFLTTNPGGGLDEQLWDGVEELSGGAVPTEYRPLSRTMARFYERPGTLKGAPRANINAMKGIAAAMGRTGVLQVEMVPWHSPNLSDKGRVMAELSQHALFMSYRLALENLIRACPLVLSWSAGFPARRAGAGVEFKATAMGLDLASANILEISRTERGISQALLWFRDSERTAGIFVTQGAASLPANRLLGSGVSRYDMIARTLRA